MCMHENLGYKNKNHGADAIKSGNLIKLRVFSSQVKIPSYKTSPQQLARNFLSPPVAKSHQSPEVIPNSR